MIWGISRKKEVYKTFLAADDEPLPASECDAVFSSGYSGDESRWGGGVFERMRIDPVGDIFAAANLAEIPLLSEAAAAGLAFGACGIFKEEENGYSERRSPAPGLKTERLWLASRWRWSRETAC